MSPRREEIRILNDNLSGSSEILASSIKYILSRLRRKDISPSEIIRLRSFTRQVARKHSLMRAVAGGMREIEKLLIGFPANRALAVRNLSDYRDSLQGADRKILDNCRKLFRKKVTIATYSNSGAVKKILSYYRLKVKAVYLSESRPACEGKLMADFLSHIGVEVHYMVDALLFQMMAEVDYLILGADSVGEEEFINKIGSRALLEKAGTSGVKRIVVFESAKLTGREPEHFRSLPSEEVWSGKHHRKIKIINRYFEAIPNSLVDLFISDFGIGTSNNLHVWIEKGR